MTVTGEGAHHIANEFRRSGRGRLKDGFLTAAAFAVVLAVVLGSGTDRWWQDGAVSRSSAQRTAMLARADATP